MSARILILHHARQPKSDQDAFLIGWIAKHWLEWGYDVQHVFGPTKSARADLLIVHVDVSVVPDAYLEFAHHFPKTVNLRLRDIRKSRISTNLIGRNDDFEGPVIVKTDLNHGGTPETYVGELPEPSPLTLSQRARRKMGIKDPSAIRDPSNYLTYTSAKAVPRSVFRDSRLVVERFLPEQHGDEYFHRRYTFFGNAERNDIWAGDSAISFWDSNGHRTWTEPVPDELRRRREQMGADYGKIDYVIRDGGVEIFDINKTPAGTVLDPDPDDAQWVRDTARELAQGITTWLPR